MSPHDRFVRLTTQLDRLIAIRNGMGGFSPERNPIYRTYLWELERLYFLLFPKRRKFDLERAQKEVPADLQDALIAIGKTRLRDMVDQYAAKRRHLEECIRVTAEQVPVPYCHDRMTRYEEAGTWEYSSQGYGARSYAQGAAHRQADKPLCHNLEVQISENVRRWEGSGKWSHGGSSSTFIVWVNTDEFGVQLLRWRLGMSLREAVRRDMKRHVNPRVDRPFLEHGYEQQVGLDYFGNIVDEALYYAPWDNEGLPRPVEYPMRVNEEAQKSA